jgi:peptidoglycan hydrolase-like protein with peptidoglycan-binding domain
VGDVVFFDWQGDRVADHVGLVEQVGDGVVTTIEGNTSRDERGSQSNGGGVFRRVRPLRTVRGFGRPAYGAAVPLEPVLHRGDSGSAVRAWQAVLLRWRPECLPASGADGDFGAETEVATRALQAAAGVTADGVVGAATRTAAERLLQPTTRAVAALAPPLRRELRRGDQGTDVKALQARLADRGWSLTPDGEFGPATLSVVRQYQAEKGLTVDGVVGPATWRSVFTSPVTG